MHIFFLDMQFKVLFYLITGISKEKQKVKLFKDELNTLLVTVISTSNIELLKNDRLTGIEPRVIMLQMDIHIIGLCFVQRKITNTFWSIKTTVL